MILLLRVVYSVADIQDVKLGNTQVNKIYCGNDLVFEKTIDTTAPITTVYPDPTNPDLTHNAGTKVWLEVNEMCTTYYTLDGSTPTTASAIFREPFTFDVTTTIKYFSVDVYGNTEAVKTTVFDITGAGTGQITSISPTATVQNTIPITVTLTNDQGYTIYYRLGTGTQQTYTAPFTVTQSTVGVQNTQITVTYWSTGEAEKSITYNTSGAIAGKAVVTATPASWYVSVDWGVTANATSYNVYRSTTAGVLGDLLSEFNTGLHYDDNTPINDTTYYYTVRAANYGGVGALSDQVPATPTAEPATPTAWRYLKIQGYGSVEESTTTRLIEFEAWEGATNWMLYGGFLTHDSINTGSTDITTIRNTTKTATSGSYPVWWLATPNANVIMDLGAERALTKLNYYSYSTATVQRTNRFKILASNTNNGTDWITLWDNSTGQAGAQPILPNGYEKIL
jgi:hypothetical protein